MKTRSFLLLAFSIGTTLFGSLNQPVMSVEVSDCNGEVPDQTVCLTEPTSYKISTYRVDLCQTDPFPSTSTSADYSGAGCVTLFNGNGTLYDGQLANNANYTLPTTGRETMKAGTYNYLTLVINNNFVSSGKYTSGDTTWRTMGPTEEDLSTTSGDPIEFSVSLSSWRGSRDQDNPYCTNNGGTASRCEVNYNGYELVAVGIGNDFVETSGSGISYMFYSAQLANPITLNSNSDGYIDITVDNGLEVYGDDSPGDGLTVRSIAIAPFIFQASYNPN